MCAESVKKRRKRKLPDSHTEYASDTLFPQWKPKRNNWRSLSNKNLYMPEWSSSPPFKVEKDGSKRTRSQKWKNLNLFESNFVDGVNSCMIFTGGPVKSSAWCPVALQDAHQYIALSSSFSEGYFSYACTHPRKGLLQIWNFGFLHKSKLVSKPEMQLALYHNHGEILDMAWCPKGCWDKPEEPFSVEILPRLGILAVACSDSYIRIYSIPHPKFLTNTINPIFYSWSEVILEPLFGSTSSWAEKSACCCLSWQVANQCGQIAGGYSNGMIFVWKIDTKATLCASEESRKMLAPYIAFQAYLDPVSSISFTSDLGDRVIASYNLFRVLKFWDLRDTRLPIVTHDRGYSRDAKWAALTSSLFQIIPTKKMKVFNVFDYFNGESTYIVNGSVIPTLISSSPSESLKSIALSDFKGSVYINTFCHSTKLFKAYESVKLISSLNDFKCPKGCEFLKMGERSKLSTCHGLVFKDFPKKNIKNFIHKISNEDDLLNDSDQRAITSVAWNPNLGNQHWLFSAGHSGLARLYSLHKIFEENNRKKRRKRKRVT